jgi:hydrogenase maturation protein HypF
LYEIFGDGLFDRDDVVSLRAFSPEELAVLRQVLNRKINSPTTSSMGRLFDAVASVMGLRQCSRFEGQAAMDVEFLASQGIGETTLTLPLRPRNDDPHPGTDPRVIPDTIVDWEPLMVQLSQRVERGEPASVLAAEFHLALAQAVVDVARQTGNSRVVLTGGCFQNRMLTECVVRALEAAGFRPYWHQRIPPNDGGIALGQLLATAHTQS